MKIYKCSDKTIKWFESYLNDRKQLVQINKTNSSLLNIKSGVPQGSILGPLLFILFINDIFLEDGLNDINLFADDAAVQITGKTKAQLTTDLQNCAHSLNTWCNNNDMVLSIEKTKVMFISNKKNSANLPQPVSQLTILILMKLNLLKYWE